MRLPSTAVAVNMASLRDGIDDCIGLLQTYRPYGTEMRSVSRIALHVVEANRMCLRSRRSFLVWNKNGTSGALALLAMN